MLDEALDRLTQQKELEKPDFLFPQGCYGALNAPLVFIGPSPGGGVIDSEYSERKEGAGRALWNEEFLEPFQDWSNGFRTSLKPIVEKILDMRLDSGASKLFAFVNFDWIPNPDSSKVPMSRIDEGENTVKKVLEYVKPKILIALDQKAYSKILATIRKDYQVSDIEKQSVKVRTASPRSYHRSVKAHEIRGEGSLDGSVLIKSLQHPARIYNLDYAERVAFTLRMAFEAMTDCSELRVYLD